MTDYVVRVQEDAFRRAEELASVLKIEAPQALGHLLYIWRWILTLKPNSAPDGIVLGRASCLRLEGAALWRGERGRLIDALLELGLIVRQAKKLRVKGTKPYSDEWKRREKARARERERRNLRKQIIQMVEPVKTQAKSRGNKVIDINNNLGRTPDGQFIIDHPIGFWSWMMIHRTNPVYSGNGLDSPKRLIRPGVPSDRFPCSGFSEWHARMKSEGISDSDLANAWDLYLGDENFRQRGWPLAVFITDGVCRPRLTQSA